MRAVSFALLILAGCGSGSGAGAASAPAKPAAKAAPASAAVCDPGAPESPCPIAGHWRIAKVWSPADKTADEMGMTGATFTVTANGDASGAIRWDGPDKGQFDIRDVCTGPYLSARDHPRPDKARATLAAALKAWGVAGDPARARHLGCDQGRWATPSDASGQWFGLVLPMGRTMAFQWYDRRFVLAERVR